MVPSSFASFSLLLALFSPPQPERHTQDPAHDAPQAAWERSSLARNGRWTTHFHWRTGFLKAATGTAAVASQVTEANVAEIARRVLEDVEGSLGVSAQALELEYLAQGGDLFGLQFTQRSAGVRVEESLVELQLTASGNLLWILSSGLLHAGAPHPAFALSQRDAAELACFMAPDSSPRTYAASVERVLLPVDGGGEYTYRPAWRAVVHDPMQEDGEWCVFVDGETGELLRIDPLVEHNVNGTVQGRGIDKGPQPANPPVVHPLANLYLTLWDAGAATFPLTVNDCLDDEAVISGDGSSVVYVSDCDGDREILLETLGGGTLQLTANDAPDHSPSVADDGAVIAFVSEVDGDAEIFVVLADGTGLMQLTYNDAWDGEPSISDDGTRIAFTSDRDGDGEIYVMSSDGMGLLQLTSNTADDHSPELSGDGSKVVYISTEDGDPEVFVSGSDGSGQAQLTFNRVEDRDPTIDDAGELIVFASAMSVDTDMSVGTGAGGLVGMWTQPVHFDLYSLQSDGSGLRQLTFSERDEIEPALSGTGVCVAYATNALGDFEIILLDLVTMYEIELTDDMDQDRRPGISDECQLILWSKEEGDTEIWLADLAKPGSHANGITDAIGNYLIAFPNGTNPTLKARLRGLYARVYDRAPGSPNLVEQKTAPSPGVTNLLFNPTGAEEFPTTQVTAYRHTDSVHEYLEDILTRAPLSLATPLPIDRSLVVHVNKTPFRANASYSPSKVRMKFWRSGGNAVTRPNTAYDAVIYHEYGHFLDHMYGGAGNGLPGLERKGALGEGFGDVVSLFHTSSPILGEGFFGPGTWVRNYAVSTFADPRGSQDRQYLCEDCNAGPEVHDHGQAFAGFAWDLHENVDATLAEDLLLGVVAGNPKHMQAAVDSIFLRDDTFAFGGDEDLTNGTPHSDALCYMALGHGFTCPLFEIVETLVCPADPPRHRSLVYPTNAPLGGFAAEEIRDAPASFIGGPHKSGETVQAMLGIIIYDPTGQYGPFLQNSGRYGGTLGGQPIRTRYLYLNGWRFKANGVSLTFEEKVLGTGSGNVAGPDGFGADTVAFNPKSWLPVGGTPFWFPLTLPAVSADTDYVFFFRLDYGEDAGNQPNKASDPTLAEFCGPARAGDLITFHITVKPKP